MGQFEREEEELERRYRDGEIDNIQFEEEMRELQSEYRRCAEEAARDAYEEEMARW